MATLEARPSSVDVDLSQSAVVVVDMQNAFASRKGLLDLGSENGVVEKAGSWFSYGGERLGQGRESARTFLKENPEVAGKIDVALRQKIGLVAAKPAEKAGVQTAAQTA